MKHTTSCICSHNLDTLTQFVLQVVKLRNAMQEYDNDRWRIISSKVGSGFSPAACRDKAQEIEALEVAAAEEEEQSQHQSGYASSHLGSGPSDPTASYQ